MLPAKYWDFNMIQKKNYRWRAQGDLALFLKNTTAGPFTICGSCSDGSHRCLRYLYIWKFTDLLRKDQSGVGGCGSLFRLGKTQCELILSHVGYTASFLKVELGTTKHRLNHLENDHLIYRNPIKNPSILHHLTSNIQNGQRCWVKPRNRLAKWLVGGLMVQTEAGIALGHILEASFSQRWLEFTETTWNQRVQHQGPKM